jgi:hypothetical protein
MIHRFAQKPDENPCEQHPAVRARCRVTSDSPAPSHHAHKREHADGVGDGCVLWGSKNQLMFRADGVPSAYAGLSDFGLTMS